MHGYFGGIVRHKLSQYFGFGFCAYHA
jgi:hypothetical protein